MDAASGAIAEADVLVVQLEIDLHTVAHALEVAKGHGVRTILNPAPAAHLEPATLALADYLTPTRPNWKPSTASPPMTCANW